VLHHVTVSRALKVFDGHNDVLLADRSFADASEQGELDLERARAGGFAGGFFAIFAPHPAGYERQDRGPDTLPEPPVEHPYALERTWAGMRKLLDLERAGALRIVRSPDDLELDGTVRAVMHIEGAEAIDPELALLPGLHACGLRSLGITWSRPNAFGHGVPFRNPSSPDTGPGLTDAGRALVRACEELGILVDLAHLNECGFWDVAAISERPLVVTHACANALVPSSRNLTDAQLGAVGESGGVAGICFHREDCGPRREDIARQVHYVAERIGPEHVALGSDFDGALMPDGMRGAQDLPLVLDDLRALGWAEDDLALAAHENFLRVLRQAQNAASSRASPTGSS
jgi:membrane dipeptidase